MGDTLQRLQSREAVRSKPVRCVTWARLIGSVAIALLLGSCIELMLYRDTAFAMMIRIARQDLREGTGAQYPVLLLSSLRCNRVDLPSHFANNTQSPYNPAAVRSPQTGEWLVFFRMEEMWFGNSNYTRDGTYLEGRMRSHPLLARMGVDALPAARHEGPVTMLDLEEGYTRKAQSEGSDIYKVADWRPFVWRNQVFLGHWMAYLPAQEQMAISVLNLTEGRVELVHRFSALSNEIKQATAPPQPAAKPSLRRSLRLLGKPSMEAPAFRREKNWGFFEEEGMLLVAYALLPCTVVLEFDPSEPDNLRLHSRHCYANEAATIQRESGLDILGQSVHMSGNLVPYDIWNGESHREYVALLHVKHPEYINWAVRIDRATKQISHITAGPILRNQDYRNEGFLKTALVVGSFHVLPSPDQAGVAEDPTLRIYYGEGDRYGCWLDVATRNIAWHRLEGFQQLPGHDPLLTTASSH